MPEFIPGLKLSELFYREAVRPILDATLPGMPHSAALVGWGSEVLGYDTPQSTDHHWGPRLLLFLAEPDYERHRDLLHETLRRSLPHTFRGYSTNFGPPDAIGVRLLIEIDSGPVDHMIDIFTIRSFFDMYLGVDPRREITPAEWLTFSEHRLLACTSGRVFHDDPGELSAIRRKLAYYPRDIWLYQLAAQWQQIAQLEAFVGRCGDVGDELGSRLIAARIVQYLMRLCFLMERRYAPYAKWFGTAFARLACAPALSPIFDRILAAPGWTERERYLARAYVLLAEQHNALSVTRPLETQVSPYYSRPYQVIHAGRFGEALHDAISDRFIQQLPLIGAVAQWCDSPDLIENLQLTRQLHSVFSAQTRDRG